MQRNIAPPVKKISKIEHSPVSKNHLDNGIPVIEVDTGVREALKLEFIFNGGRLFETKKLCAKVTNSMLKEGTSSFKSKEIAEALDFHGATLNNSYSLDFAGFSVYILEKHLDNILPVLFELSAYPTFLESELSKYKERSKLNLSHELAKNEVLAYRYSTEQIFGSNHPYGYNTEPEDFDFIEINDLKAHHKRCYNASNTKIIVSGKIPGLIDKLNRQFGHWESGLSLVANYPSPNPSPQKQVHIPKEDSIQSAIRLSRPIFNRNHPDFTGMYVLMTLLGGYFGSRLMTNIREEKGYTYNIYSAIETMACDGYIYIATEVSPEHRHATIDEIYKEMNQLREVPVAYAELEMVKSYLMGYFLTLTDGAFNVTDVIKEQIFEGLPFDYFPKFVEEINAVNPEKLQELALKYFDPTTWWIVEVG